jgi:N-acetylglucosamine malate deacetylase 1
MLKLLAIVAHPDDAELLMGGTLARAAEAGHRAGILDLTAGELGSSGDVETRRTEAAAASRILGLAERRGADLPDGALEDSPVQRAVVATHIRALRPDVVLTHWPVARHPDHEAASRLARAACFLAGLRRAPLPGEPFRPRKLAYALSYVERPVRPTFVVDITGQIDRKLDAIFAYGSQFEGRTAIGDVFGGGSRPLREQILAHAAHYGSLIRRPYGEPFATRETLRVDDITTLNVTSF